jgi:putative nucleotidyltransferase with HDIG domain
MVITGIYQIFAVGRFNYPEFKLKSGQIAETEILAPFDFPVLKPESELNAERDKVISEINKPYTRSDELLFDALSACDAIFSILADTDRFDSAEAMSSELKKAGWTVSPDVIAFAYKPQSRDKVYNNLRDLLGSLYRRGIIKSEDSDSLLINNNGNLMMMSSAEFLTVDKAIEEIRSSLPNAERFAEQLAPQLVKANLVIDEEKLNELSERSLGAIPPSEGIVLQNEVIVRKNTRISPDEIRKLESLREAYKSREMRKSPLQELLLISGLLLFVFIVISLANHYFGVQSKEERIPVADFLPLNLGFIVLVLLATINNHVLGYSNVLIPFAMVAICATILVSFEYGLLYSVCSLLVVSPFLNWETFTPVVLLLSTIITLVLIRRQNAYHEYTQIGLFLTVATILSIISIGIYKNDPLMTTVRTIGIGLISVIISMGGVMLIVPFYERKWNRATKQTLLELLDFNHPLLKKLATEAVGTYHHSLIVGNLTERAAEAIGANPLLARVGSYYHDIGKVINTDIFTENNDESSEIHDGLPSSESAKMIKNHVKEGIDLASKYKIPQPVIDIIKQHHGNSIVRYFFDKAIKNNLMPDIVDYQYPGPKPQTKEAVLVMLADIVESTTKSKQIVNEDDIRKIIDDTINKLIREGQFDEAPITMKDLILVKESMLPVLESIYRKRLDYPESKESDGQGNG